MRYVLPILLAAALSGAGCALFLSPQERESRMREKFRRAEDSHLLAGSENLPPANREALLRQAAQNYAEFLQRYAGDRTFGPKALKGLADVRAAQGRVDDAVRGYERLIREHPRADWLVVQAMKSAGDALFDAGREGEAARYYRMLVDRFGGEDVQPMVRSIVDIARQKLDDTGR